VWIPTFIYFARLRTQHANKMKHIFVESVTFASLLEPNTVKKMVSKTWSMAIIKVNI